LQLQLYSLGGGGVRSRPSDPYGANFSYCYYYFCSKDGRGLKAKLKAKEMLERLEVVLRGCVGENALNGNGVVSLDYHMCWYRKALSRLSSK